MEILKHFTEKGLKRLETFNKWVINVDFSSNISKVFYTYWQGLRVNRILFGSVKIEDVRLLYTQKIGKSTIEHCLLSNNI